MKKTTKQQVILERATGLFVAVTFVALLVGQYMYQAEALVFAVK